MTDGKLFDTSEKGAGFVAQFPIDLLIKGWQEGLKLMVVGEKRRMWIPAELAYGDTPRRPGGPHGMLVFDVELVDIVAAPAKPGKKAKVASDDAFSVGAAPCAVDVLARLQSD